MPDNPIGGLYPQPPQQGQSLLGGNPLQAIYFMNSIRQQQAQQAIGQAMQGAVGPGGAYDPLAAGAAIARDPNAAMAAGEGISRTIDQRNAQIAGSQAQWNLHFGQTAAAQNFAGSQTYNKNYDINQFTNDFAGFATATGMDPNVAAAINAGARQAAAKGQLGDFLRKNNLASIGAAGTNAPVETVSPSGQPLRAPLGAVVGQGSVPTNLGPIAQAGQAEYLKQQGQGATILASTRQLQTALPLIEQLNSGSFGPTSPTFSKLRQVLVAAGITDPNSQIDTQEALKGEADKYLLRYGQGAQNAGRSDAALFAALQGNPNTLHLTQPANLALIKNQIGLDRMDASMPQLYDIEHPGDQAKGDFLSYKNTYYTNHDPRAFSVDMMNSDQRGDLYKSLGVKPDAQGRLSVPPGPNDPHYADFQKFAKTVQLARQAGVLQQGNPAGGQ